MAQVRTTSHWDSEFFKAFLAEGPGGESIDELRAFVGFRRSPWRAMLIPGGRIFACIPYAEAPFAVFGWAHVSDLKAGSALLSTAEAFAREHGVKEIRGPMDGNFFRSYRLRLGGDEPRFYGEPPSQPEWARQLEESGYRPLAHWETWRVSRQEIARRAERWEKRFWKNSSVRVRSPRLGWGWKKDLRRIHEMLHQSYSDFPLFTPMGWDEFYSLYRNFRFLLLGRHSFFLEWEGKPVAFLIAYEDPQVWLQRGYGFLRTLFNLRFRRANRVLVPYVGKIQSGDPRVQGALVQLVGALNRSLGSHCEELLVCYLAENSPVKTLLKKPKGIHGTYALYTKDLSQ